MTSFQVWMDSFNFCINRELPLRRDFTPAHPWGGVLRGNCSFKCMLLPNRMWWGLGNSLQSSRLTMWWNFSPVPITSDNFHWSNKACSHPQWARSSQCTFDMLENAWYIYIYIYNYYQTWHPASFQQQIELAPLTCNHGDSTWVSNCKVEFVGKAPKVNVNSVVVELHRFTELSNNNPCSNLLPSLCKLIVSVMSKEEPARMWDWSSIQVPNYTSKLLWINNSTGEF